MNAFLAALMVAVAAGCASSPQTTAYGVVESVRTVNLPDDKPGDSIFAGAAIGGLLGESLGGGGVAGALLGTLGGGAAGNEVHRRYAVQQGQRIVVHLDDGRTIAVVQPAMRIEVGQRVRVLSGLKGPRVEL